MNKAKFTSRKFRSLLVLIFFFHSCFINAQTTIHYWNFNTGSTATADDAWPIANPINATLGSGVLTHNFTTTEDFTGTIINAEGADPAGKAFCPRSVTAGANNGNFFTLAIPTTGFSNIIVSYAAQRTASSFTTQTVDYSLDGSTFILGFQTITGLPASFATQTIDFSAVVGANNNPNFTVRITLTGSIGTGASNRIDNLKVTGSCITPSEPTLQSNTLTTSNLQCSEVTLNWINGNGSNRIVIAKANSVVTGSPIDQNVYIANTNFGSGGTIAAGEFVVYNGTGNAVTVKGLSSATTYYFDVFEYNQGATCPNYLTSTIALSGSVTTLTCSIDIQSLLADACVPGTGCVNASSANCICEGKNEMVRFLNGPSPINTSDIFINWPSNSYLGISPQTATTNANTSSLNSTIVSPCGLLIEPPGNIIPAGKTVLLISSTDMCLGANSFTNLADTLYVIYQNAGNFAGHFANYGTTTPLNKTLMIWQSPSLAGDTVTYFKNLLTMPNGSVGAADGAAVDFTPSGVANYFNNGCQAPFASLTANAGADNAICTGTSINLVGTASKPYSSALWQGGSGTFSSTTTLTTTYTPSVSESGTVLLSMRLIGFCNDTAYDTLALTVTITTAPIVTSPVTFCEGATSSVLTATGSNLLWYLASSGGTGVSSITPSTVSAGTTSYFVSQTINGCEGPRTQMDVIVKPTPSVTNSPLTQTICSGGNTSIVNLTSNVAGTSFSWTATASSGITGYTTSGTSTIPVQTLINSGSTSGTVTYVITPTANSCPGPVTNYIVTVNPKDNASFTYASSTYCQTGTNPTPAITGLNGGVFSSAAGLSINPTTGTINLAGSTLGTYAVTYSVNSVCPDSSVFNVTITNAPNSSFSYNGPYCQDGANPSPTFPIGASAGIFSASPSGLVFVNTTTGQIDLTASTPGTYTVKDSIAAIGGCAVALATNTVTINPTPTITNNPLTETLCSGSNTNIALTSGVSGTTFNYSASNTSGTVTGFTASATGVSSINDILTNNTSSVGTITYVITPKTALCTGIPINYVVTVNPIPTVTNTPLNETICSGANTNITLTSGVTGATFNYTANNTSGTVTGFTASGTGVSSINDILLNNSGSTGTITYVITPKTASCTGIPVNYSITVNPNPTLTNSPLSEAICSGANTTISLTSGVSGTTFDYTASNVSGMITGYTNNANGVTSINDVLNNNSSSTDIVAYLITPNANGCPGASSTYNVSVNPIPTVSNPSLTQTVCAGGTTTAVTLTSDVTGAAFTWTAVGTGSVTGYTASGTNTIPAQTISNPGIDAETVTYSITPSANGCSGTVIDYVVTVNPLPTISNTPLSASICSGTSTTPVTLTSTVSGTTFNWTATGTSGITGFATSGINTIPLQTIFNSGTTSGTVTYSITPSANACNGTVATFVLTILPLPAISNTSLSQTICSGGTTSPVTLLSNVSGASSSWTASATSGITGFTTNGANSIPAQTITNTGTTVGIVTYTIIPVANSCTGTPVNYVVTVNPPINNVIANNNTPICAGDTIHLSTPAITGATYNWTGPNSFSSNDQNPIITNATPAMSGSYSLTITIGSCNSSVATTAVTVNPGAVASFSANPLSGSAPLTVNFTNNSQNATSYLWDFDNASTNTSANPTVTFLLTNTYNVVLIAYANSLCPDTTEVTINVYDNFTLVIPNVFTPNGDGNNDVFLVTGSGIKEFECNIYDRWGLKMKQINDINIGWDGRTDSGTYANGGTYYYMIKVKGFDDKPAIPKNGFIMLIK